MIRWLLKLKAVATGRMPAVAFALSVCVATCLHMGTARSQDFAPPEGEEILPASARFVPSQPSEYDAPGVDLPLVDNGATVQGDGAAGDRWKSPLWTSASPGGKSLRSVTSEKSKWFPQGMIPYFGPRTPDSEKDRGIGWPLEGRGWRNDPFSISGFSGMTTSAALIPGQVILKPSYYGGINVGWDYDHYWGIEKRLGFGALNLVNGNHDPIGGTNLSITGEYRLMYYPLGDARWRPFLTAGLGWSDFYFSDDRGDKHLDTLGMVPFGLGVKYLHDKNLALRVDLIDEVTFGSGALSTFHYVAITAGLEVRYGRRLLKLPWHKADSDDN